MQLTLGGSLKLVVRSFTDLETSIGAIGRINSLVTKAESEHDRDGCRRRAYDDNRTSECVENWPTDGSVTFEDVTASFGYVFKILFNVLSTSATSSFSHQIPLHGFNSVWYFL